VFAYLLCENTVNMAVMLFALDHYKSNPNKGLKKPFFYVENTRCSYAPVSNPSLRVQKLRFFMPCLKKK
ncbi:MAG: hypothetical protein AAGJ18_03945, partial [Bacteroidota bacterium]